MTISKLNLFPLYVGSAPPNEIWNILIIVTIQILIYSSFSCLFDIKVYHMKIHDILVFGIFIFPHLHFFTLVTTLVCVLSFPVSLNVLVCSQQSFWYFMDGFSKQTHWHSGARLHSHKGTWLYPCAQHTVMIQPSLGLRDQIADDYAFQRLLALLQKNYFHK